ncbi:MAG: hypothetical protein KKA05_10585 [Alphaproteobacteria bacterium]|nr:hypothetical protein [Alphaproteobacteria bacterium]
MPQPEGRRLTQNISVVLTNMAMSYLPNLTQFVARRVFPRVTVGAPEGSYNILTRSDFLRPVVKKLANHEAAPIGGFNFTQGQYSTEEYGIAANWTDRDLVRANVGGIGAAGLIRAKTLYVTIQSLLGLELDTANLIRTPGNWAFSATGVAAAPGAGEFLKWSDAASDPIGQVKQIILAMTLASGFKPNKMIIPPTVIAQLSEHPDFLGRVLYGGTNGQPAMVNIDALKSLFEIQDVVVPGGVVNLGKEDQADNIDWIWGSDVWIGFAPAEASMEMPSAGYHFAWNGQDGTIPAPFQGPSNENGLFIRRYTENRPAAYFVESRYYTVPKVTGSSLGYLLASAV